MRMVRICFGWVEPLILLLSGVFAMAAPIPFVAALGPAFIGHEFSPLPLVEFLARAYGVVLLLLGAVEHVTMVRADAKLVRILLVIMLVFDFVHIGAMVPYSPYFAARPTELIHAIIMIALPLLRSYVLVTWSRHHHTGSDAPA